MSLQDCIQILTGTLGSIGFALLYNLRGKKLVIASLGGLIAWAVYLILEPALPSEPMRYFISSASITVYAEVFARLQKSPTTTFLVPSFIPLVPGSALYYTMNYALNKQWSEFAHQAFYTIELAFFLAAGIIAVTTLTRLLTLLIQKIRKQTHVSHFHHDIHVK